MCVAANEEEEEEDDDEEEDEEEGRKVFAVDRKVVAIFCPFFFSLFLFLVIFGGKNKRHWGSLELRIG